METLKCQNCNRTLLQVDGFNRLTIKCRRCGQFNSFLRTLRTPFADHESHDPTGATRGQALQQSPSAVYRSKT